MIDFQRESELRTEPETFGIRRIVILLSFKTELAEEVFFANSDFNRSVVYRYFGSDKSYKGAVAIDVCDWDEAKAKAVADALYDEEAMTGCEVEELSTWRGWARIYK